MSSRYSAVVQAKLAEGILQSFPERALQIIVHSAPDKPAGKLVTLKDDLSRPSYREISANYLVLRPIVESSPHAAARLQQFSFSWQGSILSTHKSAVAWRSAQVPSGFYLVDVLLYLDSLVEGKLYGNGPNRVKLATLDANRVKKLVGSLRYLSAHLIFWDQHNVVFLHQTWRQTAPTQVLVQEQQAVD